MTLKIRRYIWRFISGAHMDGKPRTNATWFRHGTFPKHKLNWWNAKPRIHRAAWRHGVVYALALFTYGYMAHRWLTLALSTGLTLHAADKILPRIRVKRVRHFKPTNMRRSELPQTEHDFSDFDMREIADAEESREAIDNITIEPEARKARQ